MSDTLTVSLSAKYRQNADPNRPLVEFLPPDLVDASVRKTSLKRVEITSSDTFQDVSFGSSEPVRFVAVVNRSTLYAIEAQWAYYSQKDFDADLEPLTVNKQGILPGSFLLLDNISVMASTALGLRGAAGLVGTALADVLIVTA